MSVQVSYKKQFIFGILLLVVILLVIEGFANIWWYEIKVCAFENNELFENMDDKTKKQLCLENFDLKYTEFGLDPNQEGNTVFINSEGFRGPEITKHKPENTYRIFVIGGSTTYGAAVLNYETAPFYLQEKFDETELDFKVEVINAGTPGMWSENEIKFVKERLLEYFPDLLIIYDGVNDLLWHFQEEKSTPTLWKENWIEICDLGKEYSFETIITLQPFLGTGKKILHENESRLGLNEHWLEIYPSYIKQLDELDAHCTKTADLSQIFDSTSEQIFFDKAHVVAKGNQIVAENLYKLSLPIVLQKGIQIDSIEKSGGLSLKVTEKKIPVENSDWFLEEFNLNFRNILFSYKTPRVLEYLSNSFENQVNFQTKLNQNQENNLDDSLARVNLNRVNLTGWDFSGKNLENAIFFGSDLSDANFANANLEGADFRFAILNGANFHQANLVDANFANVDLTKVNLSGMVLIDTNLSNVDLSWSNLSQTKFVNVNLTNANLVGSVLKYTDIIGSILNHADLTLANLQGANLTNSILNHADLTLTNLQGTDLQYTEIMEATLHVTNLVNADLTQSKLDGSDLFGANLEGATLNGTSLKETKLACYNHHICN